MRRLPYTARSHFASVGALAALGVLAAWLPVTASAEKGDDWFGMPDRPKGRGGVSWGETQVQAEPTKEMVLANPWWQAVRHWRRKGSTGDSVRQKMVFAGGLPRSGTTLLEMFLRSHRRISTLEFPKKDNMHEGGPLVGHGFNEYGGSRGEYAAMCSVDEDGELKSKAPMTEEEKVRRFRRWSWEGWKTWNFSKPLLAVKDPPNLVRMRFMQKAFQETHDVFAIFTLMHPLEIGSRYSCDPRSEERGEIAKNWLHCHDVWQKDLAELRNYLVIPFEAWFLHPVATGRAIENFLRLTAHTKVVLPTLLRRLSPLKGRRLVFYGGRFLLSRKYFAHCRKSQPEERFEHLSSWKYRKNFTTFGYDITNSRRLLKPVYELCVLDGKPCRDLVKRV